MRLNCHKTKSWAVPSYRCLEMQSEIHRYSIVVSFLLSLFIMSIENVNDNISFYGFATCLFASKDLVFAFPIFRVDKRQDLIMRAYGSTFFSILMGLLIISNRLNYQIILPRFESSESICFYAIKNNKFEKMIYNNNLLKQCRSLKNWIEVMLHYFCKTLYSTQAGPTVISHLISVVKNHTAT